ncbi:hypothetical protein JCM6882_002457 [Rhodosporidiobolus microsporus]
MPVGHERINARRPDPNPAITFIHALKGLPDSDLAQKILEAIAAQFKPIMKEWGFGVNSLVEHEWNPTFAGRNWNGGEVIELVLRRKDGSFAPYQFILYVMCHELAHIKEMNHSWAFKKVNQQVRAALGSLRAQGYTGDGFWSTGRTLHPDYPQAEVPLGAADEPVYTCGGANKKRGRWKRRRSAATPGSSRARGSAVKLGTTGRQTAIPAKAGGRVKRQGAFEGEGNVLSGDPEMSSKGRRAQAKGAVAARAAAAEARLAAEQRAKAAEARSRSSTLDEKKIKPDPELDIDWNDAGDADLGGWETDEEDKPHIKLEEEEKAWLREDMREWRESQAEGARGGAGAGSSSMASGSKDKGKGKAGDKESTKKRKQPPGSLSPSPSASFPSASSSKKTQASRRAPSPVLKLEGDDLDLTPAERAWLEADLGRDGSGVKEESDDEVEIIESGVNGAKKPRVVYMAMPEWMGGNGSGSGSAKKGKRKAETDSDDDLPAPSTLLSPPKAKPSTSSKTTSASAKAVKRSPPTVKKEKPKSTKGVRFDVDDDEEADEGSDDEPRHAATSPSKKRGPMKFFSSGSDTFKYAKPTKSVSPAKSNKAVSPTGSLHHRAIHPPSDDDDDDDDEEDAGPGPFSKAKGKSKSGTNSDAPPAKKPRKERSDKGKKRGPRSAKNKDGVPEVKASSSSGVEGGERKKRGRPSKEPQTFEGKMRASLAARGKANRKALLAEIDEDERREKEAEQEEDEEDQLEWTSDDEPTVKKARVAAEKALREKKESKGKGKARAVNDSKDVVFVGLELRAGGPTATVGGVEVAGPIKPFSRPVASSSSTSAAASTSKPQPKPKPKPSSLVQPLLPLTLPDSDDDALSPPSRDSSIASPLTPPPSFTSFHALSSPFQDALIAKLESDNAHNQRLKAKRVADAKRVEEEAEKSAAKARERIAQHARAIEEEAAARGETGDAAKGRAGGWGGNVFTEGAATEEAAKAGAVDPVARTQLEGLLGVALGGTGAAVASGAPRDGVPPGMEGKLWRCGTCDFDNDATKPECDMCGLGKRSSAVNAPYQFILYVMCHELAHIKEMNHSWAFKKVNQQIRAALGSLRAQGYTGDGFWSTGRTLHPDYPQAEVPLGAADEPVYTCGGANKKRGRWKRRRKTNQRRRLGIGIP